jgi:hypothetical protein
VDKLLEGEYITPSMGNLTKGAQTLLQKLGNKENLPKIDETINFEDFTKAIKTWRESTSTSPSGRHLGHYKSLMVDDDIRITTKTQKMIY